MAQEAAGWCPPNAQELLEASIPDGSQWYEVRTSLKTLSYTVDRYDGCLERRSGPQEGFQDQVVLLL